MVAPKGAPALRLNVSSFAGRSASVAETVNVPVVVSLLPAAAEPPVEGDEAAHHVAAVTCIALLLGEQCLLRLQYALVIGKAFLETEQGQLGRPSRRLHTFGQDQVLLVAIDEERNQRTVLDGLNMPIDVAVGPDAVRQPYLGEARPPRSPPARVLHSR